MLVLICRWHFRHPAPWQRKTDRISEPPQWIPHKYSVHNGKRKGHLPLLDIDIYKKTESSLGHRIYLVVTHTNLYLHWDSHHHPANEQSVLASMIHRAKAHCDQVSLLKNRNFSPPFWRILDTALSRYDKPLNPQNRPPRPTKNPPWLHSYLTPRKHGWLSRILAKHNIKSVYHQGKIYSYLPPVKDALGLRMPGVYGMWMWPGLYWTKWLIYSY